jgi:hypothetical protein
MIEGFDPTSLVIVNLVNPKEKFFGVLRSLSAAGVTMRAINLDSFDDWIRQIAKEEELAIDMFTMFVPLFRVERVFLDEPAGAIKSYSQRFEDVVGRSIRDYLGLPPAENNAENLPSV